MAVIAPSGLGVGAAVGWNELAWTNGQEYISIRIYRKKPGASSFVLLSTVSYPTHKYNDTDISTAGGYSYYVAGSVMDDDVEWWTPPSNTASTTRHASSVSDSVFLSDVDTGLVDRASHVTDTIGLTEASSVTVNWASTVSDTIIVSESAKSAQSLKANFGHYLGMEDKTVHLTDSSLLSDNGTAIVSAWETIETDLGMPDRFKTVHRASLKYVDMGVSTPMFLSVSNDGGRTWVTSTYFVGAGDGKTKSKFFGFVMTGKFFKFKIESSSTDKAFQIIGLDIDFQPCGEVIET